VAAWRPGAVEPCGALITFSLHPVVLGADNLQLTRDYPGYLSDALTREVPGCLALFACGCAGDGNQPHAPEPSWTTQGAPARPFAKAESSGGRLAGAAATALLAARARAPLAVASAAAQRTVGLPLQAPPDAPALLGRFSAAAASA